MSRITWPLIAAGLVVLVVYVQFFPRPAQLQSQENRRASQRRDIPITRSGDAPRNDPVIVAENDITVQANFGPGKVVPSCAPPPLQSFEQKVVQIEQKLLQTLKSAYPATNQEPEPLPPPSESKPSATFQSEAPKFVDQTPLLAPPAVTPPTIPSPLSSETSNEPVSKPFDVPPPTASSPPPLPGPPPPVDVLKPIQGTTNKRNPLESESTPGNPPPPVSVGTPPPPPSGAFPPPLGPNPLKVEPETPPIPDVGKPTPPVSTKNDKEVPQNPGPAIPPDAGVTPGSKPMVPPLIESVKEPMIKPASAVAPLANKVEKDAPLVANPEPGKVVSSPWTFHLEIVDGKNLITAKVGKTIQFRVICDKVDMQAPLGNIQAAGNVKISSPGLEALTERMTINLQEDSMLLEGKAHLKCVREEQEMELRSDRFSLRLSEIQGQTSSTSNLDRPPSIRFTRETE